MTERKPRRMERPVAGAIAAAAMLALGAPSGWAETRGGDVIVAQNSNPPSLDAMTTSSQASRNINMHIYEQLYTFDEQTRPVPMLAEGVEVSDDGLTYVFALREGVKFQNGKEMTSEDVKASLERYAEVGASKDIMANVASVEATGPHEVTVTLSKPQPSFIEQFSSPRAPVVIIPAEEASKGPNEIEIIGTGPYKFVEYVPDDRVVMERFDDYVPDEDGADGSDGFAGHKTAYFDTVTFRVIPEHGARAAALQAGEVHLVESLPVPTAQRFKADESLAVYEIIPWAFLTLWTNWASPPTDNPKVREAIQIALNMEEIMAIATEGLFRLDHGWQHKGTTYYPEEPGRDLYNAHDTERAKALLEEAGYNGEELVILTDTNYGEHNRAAVVIGEQLKAIGMNVRLEVTDWPTALQLRLNDEGWNLWTLLMGIEPYLGPYGMAAVFVGDEAFMRRQDAELERIYAELTTSPDQEDRVRAFADFQARIYEVFPAIKLGDQGMAQASSARVANFKPFRFPRMYNVWFE